MQFYPHRSVSEQAQRLPEYMRNDYTSRQLDRITIDGCEILGYFEYSFMEEKSYMEQPVRSDDGSIEALDDYTTFLTPRLIIKYNMMNIEDYRNLMTLLKSKNSFTVSCYDIVADRRVTHEMYFANPQMPVIYQKYLAVMGIRDYSIELIGTNKPTNTATFVFFVDDIKCTRRSNDTWISYLIRREGDVGQNYQVIYSPTKKNFYISKDDGFTALQASDGTWAYPHDEIDDTLDYRSVQLL